MHMRKFSIYEYFANVAECVVLNSAHNYIFYICDLVLYQPKIEKRFSFGKNAESGTEHKNIFPMCAYVFSLWVTQRYYINKIVRL